MRIYPSTVVGALIAIGVLGVIAVSARGSVASASPSVPFNVSMTSKLKFIPDPVTVPIGTTVIWTNTSKFDHTTTSDGPTWDSKIVLPGHSFSFTFNSPGTFTYHCSIHVSQGMIGTIIVQNASTPTTTATKTSTPTPTVTPNIGTPGPNRVYLPIVANPAATPTSVPGVSLVNYAFQPSPLTVSVGTTVVWTNTTDKNPPPTAHTVTADSLAFNSGNLNPGATFSFKFTTPGTFAYYCQYHGGPGGQGMAGSIVVVGS